jgi:hypothetical protein
MSVSIDSTLESHTHDLSSHKYIKDKVFSKSMTIQFIYPLSSFCESTKTSVNTKHLPNCKAEDSHIRVDVVSSFFEDVTPCRLVNSRVGQKIYWQCMDTKLFIVSTNKLSLDPTVLLSHWLSTQQPSQRTYHIMGQTFFSALFISASALCYQPLCDNCFHRTIIFKSITESILLQDWEYYNRSAMNASAIPDTGVRF